MPSGVNFNETSNKDVVNNIIDGLKLNPITDNIPKTVLPTIQPVYEVSKVTKFVGGSGTSATSAAAVTVLTASSTVDTYITSVAMALAKDATCDAASANLGLNVTLNGATLTVIQIPIITLTAKDSEVSFSLSQPLKIDRNTTVRFTMPTFTAGACRISASVLGYTEEAGNNFI